MWNFAFTFLIFAVASSQQTLDRKEVQTAVEYMKAIYDDVKNTSLKKWFHTGKDSYGYVAYDDNKIVVAIRGTRTVVNMIHNLKINRIPYKDCSGCQVHAGYMQTYQTSRDFILKTVKDFKVKFPRAKIYVTGYSLGATQATYCAVDLNKLGFQANLISFGSPRPGNKEFAEYANRILTGLNYRVTHGNDPCTVIPQQALGYYHVGTEVHYTSSKDYKVVLPYYSDKIYMTRVNLLDHYIGYYRSLQ